jgi:hypothetical protein
MKADEIRTKLEEYRAQTQKLAAGMAGGDTGSMIAATNGSRIVLPIFLGEIALQLAELNEKLDLEPGRIVDVIVAIQEEIDKRETKR